MLLQKMITYPQFKIMKHHHRCVQQFNRVVVLLAVILAANVVLVATAPADESKPVVKKPVPAKKKLTGAELYAINCNRCHAERYPTEFTSGQWQTLLTHMRVRANLPAKQAKEILKYLKEEAGN
jgi:hypothetical protein